MLFNPTLLVPLLGLASQASGQTIAKALESVTGKSYTLKNAIEAIKTNPEWNKPGMTLFVPHDAAWKESTGKNFLLVKRPFNFFKSEPNYVVLEDGNTKVIYDNYNLKNPLPTEIHMRWGTGEAMVVDFAVSGNSRVYVLDKPLLEANTVNVEAVLAFLGQLGMGGHTQLLGLIAKVPELLPYLNSLKDVTFFAPIDAAILPEAITKMNNDQIAALIQNHIVQGVKVSTLIGASDVLTSLLGNKNPFAFAAKKLTLAGKQIGIPTDSFAKIGIIHRVDGWLIPESLVPLEYKGGVAPGGAVTGGTGASGTVVNPDGSVVQPSVSGGVVTPPVVVSAAGVKTNGGTKVEISMVLGVMVAAFALML